jgi:very-short-patch-repair endonuclease
MATKASLASAIRTAATQVSGSTNTTSAESKQAYASSRIGLGLGPGVTRSASINSITTAPNFYSPFLTPSSFQIPNARREVYLWANWWKNNEPKVSAAINFYTNYPFSGWKLECSSSYVKDYFEKLVEKLNFQKWLPEISKVYHLLGDAFVLLSIDCPHCHGSNWDDDKNQECQHDGASWKSISILNPDNVIKTPGMIDQPGSYAYRPSAEEIRIVNERHPKDIYDSIPDGIKKLILKGDPIKLNEISIHHFKYGSNPWEDYGISMIRPLFPILTYKDKLRQAQYMIAERLILPIKVVKIGSDTRPASQEDIDNVQDELASIANDPNLTLVTHHNFDLEWYGATGKIHPLTGEFELIEQEILDGVMLNKALLNGEGPTYGNAQVGLLAMAQRLETFRREVAHWIEMNVFLPVAKWNGFVIEGERGQEEIIYPRIKFDDLQLRDDTGKLQMLVTANQNGVISNVSLIEAFGLDSDQEIERLRYEQGANFMSDQNFGTPNISLSFQSGGVTGQGFGAATGGADMSAAPPAPDLGIGGTPPPADAGAAAPPPPAGAAPAPTASNMLENYRLASEIVNSIYQARLDDLNKSDNVRTASKKIKSSAHEGFLMSLRPVTGRASLGPLPSEYDGLFGVIETPFVGGSISYPLNNYAINEIQSFANYNNEAVRQVVAKKLENVNQPKMFTSLEKKLYGLLMSLNMPFPLYAQYSAGPTMDYQLDAAIPNLKIGVEADGEIWHNNPDKIAKDKRRDSELAVNGWIIVRFTDKELQDHPQDCLNVLINAIKKRTGQSSGSSGEKFL